MSSITRQTKKKDIAPSESADVQHTHHGWHACHISKCGIAFGWRSDATRKPSRRSSHQRREAVGGLDVRLRAHPLPECERFPSDRWALREVIPAHASLSTLRQQLTADRFRFGNCPEGGGNVGGTLCRRPLAGVRHVSAGRGGALRNTPAPLSAGCRLLGEQRESADGLQKEPEGVVFLLTSRTRSAVPQSARCTQHALLRKTQEDRCMAEYVAGRFKLPRSVPNVPATGKEGTDDQDWESDCLRLA